MLGRIAAGLALAFAVATAAAAKPFVAILADRRGTVATDLLAPYAILAESGVVEVKVVAAAREPVRLTPGHAWVAPQMTLGALAGRRPDVVVVPAMTVEKDPARAAWLKAQVRDGARILAICNGARVLAAAGLLDGRQATVHWFSRGRMARRHPEVAWRKDLRWVTDGPITTTAGISAAEPATLHLLQALAGEAAMRATASRLGLPLPNQRHRGDDYRLTAKGMAVVVANRLVFWGHEDVAAPLVSGLDEIAFGVALDAWGRTYRSTPWAVGAPSVVTRHGLRIFRSRDLPARFDRRIAWARTDAFRAAFLQVGKAYGPRTARFVALQFEHPYGAVSAW
jgi:putative intracellular protease/amidase